MQELTIYSKELLFLLYSELKKKFEIDQTFSFVILGLRRGYGEMVDAADSTELSLGMETYRVVALRFRET